MLEEFELEHHERVVLEEAARTLDLCRALQAVLDRDGPMVEGQRGLKAHPALAELRQQRLTFARLLAALRVPVGEDAEAGRLQRRSGVRGTYGIRGAVRGGL